MRSFFLLCLTLAACAADPVLLPDSGPCSSACGVGTVCSGGACVAIDAGGGDAPAADVGEDRPALPDAGPGDVGVDVPADVLPAGCTSATVGNCCGVACVTPAGAMSAACLSGRCGVGVCSEGLADCDGNPANGCETNLRSSGANCGACGAACAAGRGCFASACVACDADGDGATIPACGGMDCDDTDRDRHPGATERCNGFDDNCDGTEDSAGSAELNAYCLTLQDRHFSSSERTWQGTARCVASRTPDVMLLQRYAANTLACQRCGTYRTSPTMVQSFCNCAADTTTSWSCPR